MMGGNGSNVSDMTLDEITLYRHIGGYEPDVWYNSYINVFALKRANRHRFSAYQFKLSEDLLIYTGRVV